MQNIIPEIVALTQTLIGFHSCRGDAAGLAACADFIAAYLTDQGLDFERREYDGVPSIWVGPRPDSAPLILLSHFDVIDGPPGLFRPRIENGRLYGRGSQDDKYAVALTLVLLKERLTLLRAQGLGQENLGFGALFTGDEESGGFAGAARFFPGLKADFCLALDGGGPDRAVGRQKGFLILRLTTRGKKAHGARPWLGLNAIDLLLEDLLVLKEIFPALDPAKGEAALWRPSCNLGRIVGGQGPETVADKAVAIVDIRYPETDEAATLLAEIGGRVKAEVEVLAQGNPLQTKDFPWRRRFLELAGRLRLIGEHAASDARFPAAAGIDTIIWGAEGENSQHSDDEHVVISSLGHVYQVVDRFVDVLADRKMKHGCQE